jgi:hypothetical protein
VNSDPRRPPTSDIIEALRDSETGDVKDVMALVGYVGPGRDDAVRLYSDFGGQRWMDIPIDQIAHQAALEDVEGPSVRPGKRVVWVQREWMNDPVFQEEALGPGDFEELFVDSWMSTWQLIPDTRMVAAEMLDLLPRLSERDTY